MKTSIAHSILKDVFGAAIFLLAPFVSCASNYFVNDATSGNDIYTTALGNSSNSGLSSSAPKASLTQIWNTYGPSGANVLTLGDTVFVDAGLYYQTDRNLFLNIPIVVEGAGMQNTIFDNDNAGTTGFYFARIGAAVHLENFKILRYGIQNTNAHALEIDAGITGVQINFIHIDNCGRDSGMYPIEVQSGANVSFNGGGTTCNSWLQSGGIRIQGSTTVVTINNYVFFGNSRGYDNGAALRIEDGAVTLRNTLFEANECNNGGVSILYMNSGNLSIYDCAFLNNKYMYSFNEYGGTILINGGNFYMTRSIVQNTTPTGGSFAYGAGACFDGTTTTITAQIDSCLFANNSGSRGNDLHSKRANTTVNAFQTTFGSASQQVGTSTNGTINLSNSGNPSVYINTGSTTISPSTAPSYTPFSSVPNFSGNCGAVTLLPVTLTAFSMTCETQAAIARWSTESEANNAYFELMYSTDGSIWETMGKTAGSGTSQSEKSYSLELADAPSGYYKLRQVDFDGRFTDSETLSFEGCFKQNEQVAAHFDRAMNQIELFFTNPISENADILIFNQAGNCVEQFRETHLNGPHAKLTLNETLETGIYYVQVITNDNAWNVPILIQ